MTGYRKILRKEGWPEIDRLAWEEARKRSDPFSDAGGAAHWSEKNCHQIAKSYGRWLQYLNATGRLDPHKSPAARVFEPSLRGYVAILRQDKLSSETVYGAVRNLKDALRVMAPGADLGILRRLVARLDRERAPSRNKPQRVEDPAKLLEAGLRFVEVRAYSQQPGHHRQVRAGWARQVRAHAPSTARAPRA